MKIKFFIALLALLFTFRMDSLFAERFLFETKIGHFRPFSDLLRELYEDEWDDYQFELSYAPFDPCTLGWQEWRKNWWRNLLFFGNYCYIFNRGFTFSGLDDTEINIRLLCFSLGLKYILHLPAKFDVYGSAGGRYIFLRTDNKNDESVQPHEKANGLGGIFSLGALFYPYANLVLDFFASVMIKQFDESNFSNDSGDNEIEQSLNVSGVTFGFGIGLCF